MIFNTFYTKLESTPEYEQIVNYTMLYHNGDECTSASGGWTVADWGNGITAKKYGTYMQLSCASSGYGRCNTTNTIYLNDYCGAVARANVNDTINASVDYHWFDVRKSENIGSYPTDFGTVNNEYLALPSGTKLSYFDITNKTGNQHVRFSGRAITVYSCALVKLDNWSELCNIAKVAVPANIATLLSNKTSLDSILNNTNAVNHMVKQCTGEFMVKAISSNTFMTSLNASTNASIVMSNEHWAKFLTMVN